MSAAQLRGAVLCTLTVMLAAACLFDAMGATASADRAQYSGQKVVRVYADSRSGSFSDFIKENGIRVWSDSGLSLDHVDIQVSDSQLQLMKSRFSVPVEVKVADVQELIQRSAKPSTLPPVLASSRLFGAGARQQTDDELLAQFQFDRQYLTYDNISHLMDELAQRYPVTVKTTVIGKSFEGRDMKAVHIGSRNGSATHAFVVLSGIHAREWISPAVMINIMYDLVTNRTSETTALISRSNVVFVPLVNPDGYAFTFSNDRLWRKNRQTNSISPSCTGIDLNRNFPYRYMPSSEGPCSDTFPGESAGSATEVSILTDWLQTLQKEEQGLTFAGLYDFHSYSQLWMYPYVLDFLLVCRPDSTRRFGYACDQLPSEAGNLQAVSDAAAKAILQVSGGYFTTGPICRTIYQAAGNSVDWAYGALNMTFSYAVELRPSSSAGAGYGFVLPPDQILPAFTEAYAGLKASLLETMKVLSSPSTSTGHAIAPCFQQIFFCFVMVTFGFARTI